MPAAHLLQDVVTLPEPPVGELRGLGGAGLQEIVLPEQHQDLISVHQLAGHEGLAGQGHHHLQHQGQHKKQTMKVRVRVTWCDGS